MRNIYAIICAFGLLLMSCVPNMPIKYSTENLKSIENQSIPIEVNVNQFEDIRMKQDSNEVLFQEEKETNYYVKEHCINSERNYKKEEVTVQVSRQIAEHFNEINLFQRTTYDEDHSSPYSLDGKLRMFFGKQDYSENALVGSHFGLMGEIATANATTETEIIIEITDIKLLNKNGEVVKEIGDFRRKYEGEMSADEHCFYIFNNVNDKFKEFTSDLADKIYEELQNVSFAT